MYTKSQDLCENNYKCVKSVIKLHFHISQLLFICALVTKRQFQLIAVSITLATLIFHSCHHDLLLLPRVSNPLACYIETSNKKNTNTHIYVFAEKCFLVILSCRKFIVSSTTTLSKLSNVTILNFTG